MQTTQPNATKIELITKVMKPCFNKLLGNPVMEALHYTLRQPKGRIERCPISGHSC